MKACRVVKVRSVEVSDEPKPRLRPRHVLMAVKASSICGTDVHIYDGTIPVPYPRIPGHDFSGVVEEVGQGVENFKPGDRVVAKPSFPCGACKQCQAGRYDLCPDQKLMGLHYDGCMRQCILAPDTHLIALPDRVGFDEASVLEPFTVAMNSFARLNIALGDKLVVLGSGPIGLGHVAVAVLSGAGQIVAVDVRDEALEMAGKFGATHLVNACGQDVRSKIVELTGGGAHAVIEAAGSPETARIMLDLVRKEGKIVNVGVTKGIGALDIQTLIMKTITAIGVGGNGGRGRYEAAVELAASGKIKIDQMITHRFPLDKSAEAFETALLKKAGAMKVVIQS